MTHEQTPAPRRPHPAEEFGLTEQERLWDRVSHERLIGWLEDEETTVHRVEASYNNYGEFLFVYLSRPGQERRIWITFYGAGYHDYRERWITGEWHWYQGYPLPEQLEQPVTREEAVEKIRERLASIPAADAQSTQTERGKFF